MGISYLLLCVDCASEMTLGKAIQASPDEGGGWVFGGWRMIINGEDQRCQGADMWTYVQHFMVLHRNHELRVLPQGYDDTVDGEIEFIEPEMILSQPIDPEPSPWEESQNVPASLLDRLAQSIERRPSRDGRRNEGSEHST